MPNSGYCPSTEYRDSYRYSTGIANTSNPPRPTVAFAGTSCQTHFANGRLNALLNNQHTTNTGNQGPSSTRARVPIAIPVYTSTAIIQVCTVSTPYSSRKVIYLPTTQYLSIQVLSRLPGKGTSIRPRPDYLYAVLYLYCLNCTCTVYRYIRYL